MEQFLAAYPRVHLHYTPTYSSWLNQVENWFARIERDVIARGVFTSVKDLARKLKRYIRHYNRAPKPIKWTYRDPSQRITADTTVTRYRPLAVSVANLAAPTITRPTFQEPDSYDHFSQSRPNTNLCRPSLVACNGKIGGEGL